MCNHHLISTRNTSKWTRTERWSKRKKGTNSTCFMETSHCLENRNTEIVRYSRVRYSKRNPHGRRKQAVCVNFSEVCSRSVKFSTVSWSEHSFGASSTSLACTWWSFASRFATLSSITPLALCSASFSSPHRNALEANTRGSLGERESLCKVARV